MIACASEPLAGAEIEPPSSPPWSESELGGASRIWGAVPAVLCWADESAAETVAAATSTSSSSRGKVDLIRRVVNIVRELETIYEERCKREMLWSLGRKETIDEALR